ncbi:MAG: hypothetical protein NZM04_05415 [Methylacidiphilales bacterium]|nr:hypothetical protein [Candidatus Methylacidiphilales bacterium]
MIYKQYSPLQLHPSYIHLNHLQEYSFSRLEKVISEVFELYNINRTHDGRYELYLPSSNKISKELGLRFWFDEPDSSPEECRLNGKTYSAKLYCKIALNDKLSGEWLVENLFICSFPYMTPDYTFIINGCERIVVPQIVRAPGVYFSLDKKDGLAIHTSAKIIPMYGKPINIEIRKNNAAYVKIGRSRSIFFDVFIKGILALIEQNAEADNNSNKYVFDLYGKLCESDAERYLKTTVEEECKVFSDSLSYSKYMIEVAKIIMPNSPISLKEAAKILEISFFDLRYFNLSDTGRFLINKKLGLDVPLDYKILHIEDLIMSFKTLIDVHTGKRSPDDYDHLGNKQVKGVADLIYDPFRKGILKMISLFQNNATLLQQKKLASVSNIINTKPVQIAIREFFNTSSFSQIIDQTNVLSEISGKRTITALGKGGLSQEFASFEARDVHHTHYGRICPIETPEGKNIGLVSRIALYARVNNYGLIETPYRKVKKFVRNVLHELIGRRAYEDIVYEGNVVVRKGDVIEKSHAEIISSIREKELIQVFPYIDFKDDVVYIAAYDESEYIIARSNIKTNDLGEILDTYVEVRHRGKIQRSPVDLVDYLDLSYAQIVGISAALIPFIEHNEAARALMGANMQRQAVPLIQATPPLVSTGLDSHVASNTNHIIRSTVQGEVVSVTSRQVVVKSDGALYHYALKSMQKTNQNTCFNQIPCVNKGDRVKVGDVLACSYSTLQGVLSLGANVLVAFISWEGYNYEDAILISERIVREDVLTSIHIEQYEIEAKHTNIGDEEITKDIPGISHEDASRLDENGIVCIGSYVKAGDILVGKIAPVGEHNPTPEDRLLRAIFGARSKEVKDVSLRVPHGKHGVVIDVQVFDRDLPPQTIKKVRVSLAQKRKISIGDKLAGRHGNKGVISKILPMEEMPFLEDGTPIDIVLNPLGIPGRMNIGQILEAHLGWVSDQLGFRAISPAFNSANESQIAADLARAWLFNKAYKHLFNEAVLFMTANHVPVESMKDDLDLMVNYIYNIQDKYSFLSSENYKDIEYNLHSIKRTATRIWLKNKGLDDPLIDILMGINYDPNNPKWTEYDDITIRYCTKFWLEELLDIEGLTDDEIMKKANEISKEKDIPLPTEGKFILYDGRTGRRLDRPITVGVLHILKLSHMVEDKCHARSTGQYSLITHQPLGGRSNFGGQRMGEMECWALQAYGAAHTLHEMLTIKSDDVEGRIKVYDAIVNNDTQFSVSTVPSTLMVLVKELNAMGLNIEGICENGELINFNKSNPNQIM